MANDYSKILELANKNNMGLSNTIKRDYGIPLDYSSVQETYAKALEYAKTSTLAYIGQPISVGDTLYIVTDADNGYLKAVGTRPTGDDKTIVVNEDGKISIKGFEAAAGAYLPRVSISTDDAGKEIDRSIEWVPIDAIVEGDGNTKAVVVAAEGSAITVTPTYNRDSDTYTYTLDVTLPAIPDVPEYSVTATPGDGKTVYKLTKDGTAVGAEIEVPDAYDDSDLDSRITAVEGDIEDHESRLAGIELFFEDAAKDEGSGEGLKNALDTLKEIQEYITTDGAAGTAMSKDIQDNKTAIATLTGADTVEGSVKKTVKDAINAQAAIDDGKYATQSALEQVKATADAAAVKTEVQTALADKVDKTTLENYYTKEQTYDKTAVDNLVSGASTAAGNVANELSAHKTASDAKFEALDAKNESQDTAIQKNASDIAAINHATDGILAKAKKAAAEDAQSKIDTLVNSGAVYQNTAAISGLDSKITNTNTNVTNLTTRVTNLEQADTNINNSLTALSSAHDTLVGTVGGHTASIKSLEDRATAVEAEAAANTAKWKDYSTTEQVNSAIDAKIAAIDHTDLENGIAANTKAISDEAKRASDEEKRLADLIDTNDKAIKANAAEIERVDGVLKAALENDTEAIDSIKELAEWVTKHDGATGVLATVNANKAAIETLNGTATTEGSVRKIVADAIADIPNTLIATNSTVGVVKGSADIEIASDGTMTLSDSVFSTDRLIQGTNTLVLNGGTANVTAVTA